MDEGKEEMKPRPREGKAHGLVRERKRSDLSEVERGD